MNQRSIAAGVACLLLFSLCLPAQKKSPPRTIRFQGAAQYTQQELLTAAGLTPDARLNPRDVKAHAKLLSDTGLFDVVRFSSDSKGLLFTLTPASQLFPIHLENVPLTPGKDLDDMVHNRCPLYRGLLPASGSMVEGVRQTLEQMLAAKGIKATVKAALTSDLGPQKLTAMNFTVVSPDVRIGHIQLSGVSPAMQARADVLVNGQTGNSFATGNSAIGLQHAFEELYQDQGYAAVEVDVAQGDPLVRNQAVEIPYTVTIKEGGIYKLGTIDIPAGGLVPRVEVEKVLSKYAKGSGRPLDLFLLAVRDAYHAHGYLDCSVVPRPSFNESSHVVNYTVEIAPGTQYRLASIRFDGAPDAMAARLKLAWKMSPGDIFDESYVSNFAAFAQKKDRQLARWMQTVITTDDVKPDPATHEVDCIFHFAKAAENPH